MTGANRADSTKRRELRDLEQGCRLLLQGLWLQRSQAPTPEFLKPILGWCQEIVAADLPLPAPGFVADLGHIAFQTDLAPRQAVRPVQVVGLPPGLLPAYEDRVLGKLYGDYTFERAADALRLYQGRDRARGLAYITEQIRRRAGFEALQLNPSVFRHLLQDSASRLLNEAWDSLNAGVMPELLEMYESLIAAFRQLPEVLGPEDLFELEHGTALQELGQRLALRQVLEAVELLQTSLSQQRPQHPSLGKVPTQVLDEDTYPVGGFASLSTRGSAESLLHSQLAFMEKDRPDLFDIKYLRDELLYYSRDENQFLRRRRTFFVVLYPDLTTARFKDSDLPFQRIVLTLALVVLLVRRLIEWLSDESLIFEVLLLRHIGAEEVLADELKLLQTLLREQRAVGTVVVEMVDGPKAVVERCRQRLRRSQCQCLTISADKVDFKTGQMPVTQLRVAGPRPHLTPPRTLLEELPDPLDSLGAWVQTAEVLLRLWV